MDALDMEFLLRFAKLDQDEKALILQLMREIADGNERDKTNSQ